MQEQKIKSYCSQTNLQLVKKEAEVSPLGFIIEKAINMTTKAPISSSVNTLWRSLWLFCGYACFLPPAKPIHISLTGD